jgi:hypothetical protein
MSIAVGRHLPGIPPIGFRPVEGVVGLQNEGLPILTLRRCRRNTDTDADIDRDTFDEEG